VFPVEVLSTCVEFDGVKYGISHVRDISDRRRADVQLKESEARFQRAIAGSRDGLWDWDIETSAVWFSPRYKEQLGHSANDPFPPHVETWSEKVHPDDLERVMAAVQQHLIGVAPYDIEYRMRISSGEYRWFHVKGQAFWDDDGLAVRMAGSMSDVTDQRRAQETLELRERRLQFLIEHTPAAVAMFDRDMRYIRHSRKWLTDYGLDEATLIGRSHYDVFPDLPERWKQIHRDGVAGQIQSCQEDCFVREDGSEVWLEWAIHPWTDDDGEIGGIVMFTNVITQRKQTERALEQARRHAEAANLAKSEFLANMSHEIRTPLTAIMGFTELVKDRQRDAETVELCTTIVRNGEHLLELINDILDLSKVEAGRVELQLEACSPAAIARDIGQTLKVRADQKWLGLSVDVSADVPARCRIDVRRLRQILINLVGNAIKFTAQGAVAIQLRQVADAAGRWLEFAVTDTGIGIPADKLSLLFEPFSQIDSSPTRAQGGTGLGLCISRRLARMCGGDIAVISAAGAGSTFTVRLPMVPVTAEPENLAAVIPSLPGTLGTKSHESPAEVARILIAEDSPDNRRLLDFVLRKAGLVPAFVENGQQLVERLSTAAATDDFDLVLVDMQMPVMDGYTAVRTLRERGCRLPLIALTANAMEGDCRKCLEAGCDEYLTKPIDRAALLAAATAVRPPRETVVETR